MILRSRDGNESPARPGSKPPAAAGADRVRDGRGYALLISEDGVYPHTDVLGGMELHGAEVARLLGQRYDLIVLTNKGAWVGNTWRPLPYLAGDWLGNTWYRLPGPTGSPGTGLQRAHIPWPLRKTHSFFRAATWRARMFTALRFLERINPQLIYLKKFYAINPAVWQMYLRRNVPIIAEFNDPLVGSFAPIMNELWQRSSDAQRDGIGQRLTLVFNCQFLLDHYAPMFPWPVRRRVIYHGVDPRLFHPAATPPGGNHWMFLGRVNAVKRFVDFCRAMALLPRRLVDSIHVVGSGPALSEGLAILRASGRSDLVSIVGPRPKDAVPYLLRRATILVHPSTVEGLPASVVEAMASGLAVVASDACGTPEVIQDGVTGLLVPQTNFMRLVRACWTLAESPSLRQRLGRSAREYVVTHQHRDTFARSIQEEIMQGSA